MCASDSVRAYNGRVAFAAVAGGLEVAGIRGGNHAHISYVTVAEDRRHATKRGVAKAVVKHRDGGVDRALRCLG